MCVGQDIGISFLPVHAVGKFLPEFALLSLGILDAVHQRIVVVEFHHARTASKGATHLAHHAIVAHILRHVAEIGEDEPVGHQRVDGAKWRTLYIVLINKAVTIGDPFLTVGAHTDFAIVIFLAPCSIGDVIPERRSPRSHSGIVEDVGPLLAHVVLNADDGLAVFKSGVGQVGTYGGELGADAVELEEAEVILLNHVVATSHKVVIIFAVAELHAALSLPVVAAVSAAGAISANWSEPGTDACAHLFCQIVFRRESIGEVAVESPRAVFVPTVVPNEGNGFLAVFVIEIGFPMFDDVGTLCIGHIASVIALGAIHTAISLGIVAVDVQFIPGNINWHCTPRHCTLALAVCQERTTLLPRSDQADHGTDIPCFSLLQRGVAPPITLHGHLCRGKHVERVDLGVVQRDTARGSHGIVFLRHQHAQGAFALLRNPEAIGVAFF